MKFFIKDFFSKCDQIRSFLQIWSHLLKKSLIENFIFCAVLFITQSYLSAQSYFFLSIITFLMFSEICKKCRDYYVLYFIFLTI